MNTKSAFSGARITEAAEFLIEILGEGEKASAEVYSSAKEKEIVKKTLDRARYAIGVKARKRKEGWVIYISAENRETAEKAVERHKNSTAHGRRFERGQISSDWLTVIIDAGKEVLHNDEF